MDRTPEQIERALYYDYLRVAAQHLRWAASSAMHFRDYQRHETLRLLAQAVEEQLNDGSGVGRGAREAGNAPPRDPPC